MEPYDSFDLGAFEAAHPLLTATPGRIGERATEVLVAFHSHMSGLPAHPARACRACRRCIDELRFLSR